MLQQQSAGWISVLRTPRVGIGALAVAMLTAFVAGAIVVAVLVGVGAGHVAPSAAIPSTFRLNVGDFGTAPQAVPAAARPQVVAAPGRALNVQDFGTQPQAVAHDVDLPWFYNVGDFGTPPAYHG
jgi:hypothetical protein